MASADAGPKQYSFRSCLLVCLAGANGAVPLKLCCRLVYEEGLALSDWLMSEKLDGVRGYWDGRQLFSKNGVPFQAPPAFTRNFPDFAVEGEIWGGRQTFEKTVGIVRRAGGLMTAGSN
jgi:DNA ligase-1